MVVVSILLVLNMLLMHPDKIGKAYYWIYKKLKSPKFKAGEFVFIDGVEFEIVYVTKEQRPYTYLCVPVFKRKNPTQNYYHESEIRKKTGLLKELE
jgi:hypothetical protein